MFNEIKKKFKKNNQKIDSDVNSAQVELDKDNIERDIDMNTDKSRENLEDKNVIADLDIEELNMNNQNSVFGNEVSDQDLEVDVDNNYEEEVVCSRSELDKLNQLVRELEQKNSETQDKFLRSLADLENLKKRHVKERSDLIKYSGEYLARDIIDIVDDFERALDGMREANDPFAQGIQMIYSKFINTLDKHSIKSESALGLPLDPQKHDALTAVPPVDGQKGGIVVNELRKAYFLKDKLLRPAQCVVTQNVPESSISDDNIDSE